MDEERTEERTEQISRRSPMRSGLVTAGGLNIEGFVDPIIPAVQAVQSQPPDQLLNAAIQQNIRLQVQQLSASQPLLAPLVASGKLKVVGAEYQLAGGQVQLVT